MPADVVKLAKQAGFQTPLEYMLAVMNDPAADPERRDRMAQAAAPLCHSRVAGHLIGAKERAAAAAKAAGEGSEEWGTDLRWPRN